MAVNRRQCNPNYTGSFLNTQVLDKIIAMMRDDMPVLDRFLPLHKDSGGVRCDISDLFVVRRPLYDVVPLLFQYGYLTIAEDNMIGEKSSVQVLNLDFPNEKIAQKCIWYLLKNYMLLDSSFSELNFIFKKDEKSNRRKVCYSAKNILGKVLSLIDLKNIVNPHAFIKNVLILALNLISYCNQEYDLSFKIDELDVFPKITEKTDKKLKLFIKLVIKNPFHTKGNKFEVVAQLHKDGNEKIEDNGREKSVLFVILIKDKTV